ncbi:uncharacterized protein OCT59_023599 [Rhizophagus irregularis]|uniref:Ack1p n=1 Tax=Rhizophagus irregularis (strain DAOM 197198w) TaxID=1432141 RepID=A0A015KBE0_RHIIW|nr:Ack1p [Rhizophagus irregularis DAOM 197198w]UZO03190.1 hypothetical protein OCT59_023599 [Rhizophagus irregularis]GET58318.1 kinase-like domain-containing protein [Rhizophagus irregularis DAOM 181602=DAOM 197198]
MSVIKIYSDNFYLSNTNNLLIENNLLNEYLQNFDKINIKEIKPTIQNIHENIFEEDLSIVIDELINLIFKELNEGKDEGIIKRHVHNFINNYKLIPKEIYNWLLNNQYDYSNNICLLGYFNYYGIETNIDKKKAIELYQKAAELENNIAQLYLAEMYVHGKGINKNCILAFELSKKLADKGIPNAIDKLGYCYEEGIGIDINLQKAFELYQKAADLGNSSGINNLGWCYEEGIGTDINIPKAFELYQKAADSENSYGLNNLGCCYDSGIGTNVNTQKAFELYLMAANLENKFAQFNLGVMYEIGNGIEKNKNQAIYWYKKSAKQGHENAVHKLDDLLDITHV